MMQPGQRAVVLPAAETVVDRAPRRQVLRDRALLAPGAQHIHQPIDHLAHVNRALVTASLRPGDFRLDQRRFLIGQAARVAQLATVIATTVPIGPHRKLSADWTLP